MNKYDIIVLASAKYIRGLKSKIAKLAHSAESYPIQTRSFFRQYGFTVRAIKYKKMSVVYLVVNQTVYIRAIIPSATIRGL